MMTLSNGNIFRVTGPLWGNPPVIGGFPSRRPVTRSFGVFFDLRLNTRLSKQSRRLWSETLSPSLWRHCYRNTGHLVYASMCWFNDFGKSGQCRRDAWQISEGLENSIHRSCAFETFPRPYVLSETMSAIGAECGISHQTEHCMCRYRDICFISYEI